MNDAAEPVDPAAAYWTAEQARAYLGGVTDRTFARWRVRHYKVRGLVRYARADLDAFMQAHAVDVIAPRRSALAAKTKTPARRAGTRASVDAALDALLN